MAKNLIDHNANVNVKTENEETDLKLAFLNGNNDIFKLLLQKNANVNQKDKNGKTLLMTGDFKQTKRNY